MICRRSSNIHTCGVTLVLVGLARCCLVVSANVDEACGKEADNKGEDRCQVNSISSTVVDDPHQSPSLVQQIAVNRREAVLVDTSSLSETSRDSAHSTARTVAPLLKERHGAGDLPKMESIPQLLQALNQRIVRVTTSRSGMKLIEVILLTCAIVVVAFACLGFAMRAGQFNKQSSRQEQQNSRSSASQYREHRDHDRAHVDPPSFRVSTMPAYTPPARDMNASRRQNGQPKQAPIAQAPPSNVSLPPSYGIESATASLPPSSGIALGGSLCPELMVPKATECTLVAQRIPPRGAGRTGVVSLRDNHGKPVFEAEFDFGKSFVRGNRRLSLASPGSESIFAFCCDGHDLGSGLTIFTGKAAPFGQLREAGGTSQGYTVICNNGMILTIHGDVFSGNMNVVDSKGGLVAMAEPLPQAEGTRCFRIGPEVDAGLIATALLGIDVLEFLKAD